MARNTQTVEIDLRSGVVTNESLLAIGPRLWQARNSVWEYRYPHVAYSTATGPWMHRQPLMFPPRSNGTFTGAKTFRDIGFITNTDGTRFDKFVALIGTNSSDQYGLWGDLGGTEYPFGGGVTRSTTTSTRRGCSATWLNPGTDPNGGGATTDAVLVFSHPNITHVYYLLETASAIRSLTTDTTNCPAGASGICVHLDRLWIMDKNDPAKIYYTDPLNLDSIRTTNVIQIPDTGRAIIPGQFGTIDPSGIAHLIIGGGNSVWVLDGDPQLGGGLQADLRCLGTGVGILGAHATALTRYGVFFLGNDGDLWLIPPGCQTMQAVGAPIRNALGVNNFTQVRDTAEGSLVWFDPYLYIFPGGDASWFYIAEPSERGLAFWGPIGPLTGRTAVIRSAPYHFASHAPSTAGLPVPSVHSIEASAAGGAAYRAFDSTTAPTGSYPDGANTSRNAILYTGLISAPQHGAQPMRVILETLRLPKTSGNVSPDWTVQVFDEQNNFATAVRTPDPQPTFGTYNQAQIATQHFAIPQGLPAGRALGLKISVTAEANLGLQRAALEFRLAQAQF